VRNRNLQSIGLRARFVLPILVWAAIGFPLVFGLSTAAAADAEIWSALRTPGHAALIRHAVAPGTGDPAAFTLGDCATQRNLSEAGRRQARTIGALFRDHGIRTARVYSSQWCRSLDTARLIDLGPVQELPVLNSFFSKPELGEKQTESLKAWLANRSAPVPAILVTHQVNITALTDVYPDAGEIVVVRATRAGAITVVGTLKTQ
jgi:hypothetical protein